MFDWKWVSVVLLVVGIFVLLLLISAPPAIQPLSNGSLFPTKTLTMVNNTGVTLTSIDLSDSLGNYYNLDNVIWLSGKSITINIAALPHYASLQLIASMGTTDEIKVYLLNVNDKMVILPLLGTEPNAITFQKTKTTSTINPILVFDDNPSFKVEGNLLKNGMPFPTDVNLRNNTYSAVLENSNDETGLQPSLNYITVTSYFVMDSQENQYADSDSNAPVSKSAKSTIDISGNAIALSFVKPIKPSQNVQFYVENSENNYTMVLYNDNGKVVIIYPPIIDPTAFPFRFNDPSPSEPRWGIHGVKEPCRTLHVSAQADKKGNYTAVFNKLTLWRPQEMDPPTTATSMGTLKVGFVDGEPWQWAWIALKMTESKSIGDYAAIDFNFVFPVTQIPVPVDPNATPLPPLPNATPLPLVTPGPGVIPVPTGPYVPKYPIDPSCHIRISFDPTGGCWSFVGNQSIQTRTAVSMNYGWMDAPYNTTFFYNNVSYTTPSGFDQGNYPGIGTTIVHEFCHALGMEHEHQNPNGVSWNWNSVKLKEYFGGPPNNWTSEDINLQILKKLQSDTMNASEFDFNSIMRYAFPVSCIENASNFQGIDKSPLILSNRDKEWFHKVYPGRNVPILPMPTSCPPGVQCDINLNDPPLNPIIITNEPTVNCSVSAWTDWTTCSLDKNGRQSQKRTIVDYPTNNGTLCPPLVQYQSCNQVTTLPYDLIPYSKFGLRRQWYANFGYCGETSYIASAMFYGMYMSQYDLRAYTSVSRTQSNESDQVLLGERSEKAAADLFKMTYERWSDVPLTETNTKDTTNFLLWTKSHLDKQHTVVSAVYEYKDLTKPSNGQNLYDHIITMLNVSVDASGNPTEVSFSDYGIMTPILTSETNGTGFVGNKTSITPYLFTYDYPGCSKNRIEATASASAYSIVKTSPKVPNYGTALTGINSTEPALVRLQLISVDASGNPILDYESNHMGGDEEATTKKFEDRPARVQLDLKLHLYNLQANTTYNLYRYKDPLILPTGNFNQFYTNNASNPSIVKEQIITTSAEMHMIRPYTIYSNEVALFRCVPSSAA